MRTREHSNRRSRLIFIAIGLVLVIVIGFIDIVTGPEYSICLLYLMPISLITWYADRRMGIIISIISAITLFFADTMSGAFYSKWIVPYWNSAIRLGFFLVTTFLLASLKKAFDSEKAMARMDSLTGAVNGKYFVELANEEIARASRYRHHFTFAYIDLDNFKNVNDHFGHIEGDDVLSAVVDTIRKNIRATDMVARLGGDEFAILFPETGEEEAKAALRKIQKNLLDSMEANEWPVTFSIGAVTFKTVPFSVNEMIRVADALMYSVKNAGKNEIKHEVFLKS